MTGRMFRTFYRTEYSYDVCIHVMMRDMLNDLWSVSGMSKTKQNNYLKTIEREIFFSRVSVRVPLIGTKKNKMGHIVK
jgi:hypothetical protein